MYFKLYEDKQGDWRWTLHAANHRKIADSAEGYNNKSDCEDGIDLVKSVTNSTPGCAFFNISLSGLESRLPFAEL